MSTKPRTSKKKSADSELRLRDKYQVLLAENQAKYGERTCVFMQVGKFYECYGDVKDDGTVTGNIVEVAAITGLNLGKRDDKPRELHIGMQTDYLDKYVPNLIEDGWTVVVMDQFEVAAGEYIRKISCVYTPGTYTHNVKSDQLYLTIFLVKPRIGTKTTRPTVEFYGATVDLTRGTTITMSSVCRTLQDAVVVDDIKHYLQSYSPQEIVFYSSDAKIVEQIIPSLGIAQTSIQIISLTSEQIKEIEKKTTQEDEFATIFQSTILTDVAAAALTLLVRYCKDHVSALATRLEYPVVWNKTCGVLFGNNSLEQLNIIGGASSLVSMLNVCKTAIGRRAFVERLLNPITDVELLTTRYDTIGEFIAAIDSIEHVVHTYFGRLPDLDRLHHRMSIQNVVQRDLLTLHQAYENVLTIVDFFKDSAVAPTDFTMMRETYAAYVSEFNAKFNWCNMIDDTDASEDAETRISSHIIAAGIDTKIDEIGAELAKCKAEQDAWLASISKCLKIPEPKLLYSEKTGYIVATTHARWKSHAPTDVVHGTTVLRQANIEMLTSKNDVRFTFSRFKALSEVRCRLEDELETATVAVIKQICAELASVNAALLRNISAFIAWVDVNYAAASTARDYSYICPTLADGDAAAVSACALRHPIIERINTRVPYVPNDITLGGNGMLLFGLNAAGKSSLMKAVGCTIIMAQAGFYVPAESFIFTPYKHIFTRILNKDNMYQGLSTFAVEMTELRNILHYATRESLVLGDELCSGTEIISAVAIVGAGVETLAARGASFIFATHLHGLTAIASIVALKNVAIKHLHVEVDARGRLVYERTLRDGAGSSTYGLEVCRTMDMPADFIGLADKYRREICGEKAVWNVSRSTYNTSVRMQKCSVCGSSGSGLETHHIIPQAAADAGGFVKRAGGTRVHKNVKSNLVVLCPECHDKHHSGAINIVGWIDTSSGPELITHGVT